MKKQLRIGIYILLATLLASVAVAQEPTNSALRSGQKGVITMTTSSKVGDVFNLIVKGSDISIVGLEKKTDSTYTITSQTIKIEGEVQSLKCPQNDLTSLTLERCSSLTELIFPWNNEITSLDLSSCTALTKLDCSGLEATSLDLSHNTALTELNCYGTSLTSLDLSHNTALTKLNCGGIEATTLDLSHNTALTELYCNNIYNMPSLDLSHNKALKVFSAEESGITKLDFSQNKALEVMVAEYSSQLVSLTLPKSKTLRVLNYSNTGIGEVEVSNYPALEELGCESSKLTHLDLSNNRLLKRLDCSDNYLTSLDLSKQTALELIACSKNLLTKLELANCPNLTTLNCNNNVLTKLELPSCPNLKKLLCEDNLIMENEMTNLVKALPDRNGKPNGSFMVFDSRSSDEKNVCYTYHVDIAKAKGWYVSHITKTGYDAYQGAPTPTYEVTLSANEEGGKILIAVAGSNDLKKVPYGTELVVVDQPKEGYELTALTANGTDILATKKVFISGHTIIKATFAKKTFAVTLTKEGEGTITATGASDLKAVAYGTELTIVATPATGYELVSLDANGTDITATKKVVVKENLTVKATFAKKTFAVTLTKEGEGTITATGASNLNTVAYGTELTIVATPATGYELVSLDANGVDITATKKVVVKENLTVKATFTKLQKNYVVTLKSNEHGTITIKEDVDLKAVPEGTKLTVVAKGANDKCELTKLTANGEDILKDKTFTVTKDTEVVAEFVDHTGIDAVAADAFVIYPNPASESATVTGLAPEAAVALYTLDGQLIMRLAADRSGRLQIDLTALSDGTYLVVTEGATQRLVVKR